MKVKIWKPEGESHWKIKYPCNAAKCKPLGNWHSRVFLSHEHAVMWMNRATCIDWPVAHADPEMHKADLSEFVQMINKSVEEIGRTYSRAFRTQPTQKHYGLT